MRSIIKWIAALAVLALLALAITGVVRLVNATVSMLATDGGEAGLDPMFAGEAELTTRPPELAGEEGSAFEDNSANWDIPEGSPVDMTADELAREADAQNNPD